ncbi:39933_t:CDS:2 [Gigaspora margarita]|uniref:39933_t:CDS:1 n=1 Tax=Gigaspora margarita TaxID=4874 RepID=A0ABN7UZX4_GIGMA|nr:39933_t:CDS:2 [Gigaspora margarita]
MSLATLLNLSEISRIVPGGLNARELFRLSLVNRECARNFIPQLWKDPFSVCKNDEVYKIRIVCILLNRLDKLDINFNDIYATEENTGPITEKIYKLAREIFQLIINSGDNKIIDLIIREYGDFSAQPAFYHETFLLPLEYQYPKLERLYLNPNEITRVDFEHKFKTKNLKELTVNNYLFNNQNQLNFIINSAVIVYGGECEPAIFGFSDISTILQVSKSLLNFFSQHLPQSKQ